MTTMRSARLMLLAGGLALAVQGMACAQEKTARPLTAGERAGFLGKHQAIVARLVEAGLPRREDPVIHIGETPIVSVIVPVSDSREAERVSVDDDFLGTTFARSSGELLGVLNRAVSNWRGIEAEKGTRFPFVLTKEHVEALIRGYVTAIEGSVPEGPGGFDERVATLTRMAERDGYISAHETIHARWPRMYKGFPFRNDRTGVTLSAVNGELISYGRIWHSLPPPSVDVKIQEDDAVKVAKETVAEELRRKATFDPEKKIQVNDGEGWVFASREAYEKELAKRRKELQEDAAAWEVYVGVEPTMEAPPELMLVNPNITYTEVYNDELVDRDRWVRQTQLAWVVRLQYRRTDNVEGYYCPLPMEVWLDAAEGKVIGGVVPY